MQAIADLCSEHRLLEEQAARLAHIAAAAVPDPAAIAVVRWRMAQALADHCAREDRMIYEGLLTSGDVAATAIAWAYRHEHSTLTERFGRYVADWPVKRVAREWEAFRAETREVLDALADRILSEEHVLYAHSARVMGRRAA
jgi:hypothetical protein